MRKRTPASGSRAEPPARGRRVSDGYPFIAPDRRALAVAAATGVVAATLMATGCKSTVVDDEEVNAELSMRGRAAVITPADFAAASEPEFKSSSGGATAAPNPDRSSERSTTAVQVADARSVVADEAAGSLPPSQSESATSSVTPSTTTTGAPDDTLEIATGGDTPRSGDTPPTSGAAAATAAPPPPPPISLAPGQTVTVGGVIGQINGRPIYLDDFFNPLASRLAILGAEHAGDSSAFILAAREEIEQQTQRLINNELLLAEGRSLMTPEYQVGMRHLLDWLRDNQIRKFGGYESAANEQLERQYGITLDQQVEQIRDWRMLNDLIFDKMEQRITVTWRDIERYYRLNEASFNPPASIQLRIIRLPESAADTAAIVKRELENGLPFEEVARLYSASAASSGGALPPIPLPDGIEDTTLTAWPAVDEAARTLEEGEWAGPIIANGSMVWVYIENYETGEGRTLYEVQAEIEETIRNQRLLEAQSEYIYDLRARGNMVNNSELIDRLTGVAYQRWYRPE